MFQKACAYRSKFSPAQDFTDGKGQWAQQSGKQGAAVQNLSQVHCKIGIKNSSVSFKGDMNSFPVFYFISVDGSVALMGWIPSWWTSNSNARWAVWYMEVSAE